MAINSLNHLKIGVSKDESAIKNNDTSFDQTFELCSVQIQEDTDQKNLRI